MSTSPITHRNNFDLIRLVAASQVVIYHILKYMDLSNDVLWRIGELLPGVPIFFFLSGHLVSRSFERNPDLGSYVAARALRILPALYACVALSVVILVVRSGTVLFENISQFVLWVACQLTLFQGWNPEFLDHYGSGRVNPSLWTIPVEILFYVCVPLLYHLMKYKNSKIPLFIVLGLSFVIYVVAFFSLDLTSKNQMLAYRVLSVSPASIASYLWMFLLGYVFSLWRPFFLEHLSGKFLYLVAAYVLLGLAGEYVGGLGVVFGIQPFGFFGYFLLSCVIFSAAYTRPDLSHELLKGADISYGLYLFHMPVANLIIDLGYKSVTAAFVAIVGVVCVACSSWILIERPAMNLRARIRG